MSSIFDALNKIDSSSGFTDDYTSLVNKGNAQEWVKDPRFLSDITEFYKRRDGKTFNTSEEAVDHFFGDRAWRNTNVVSVARDAIESQMMPDDQRKRLARLQTVYDQYPDFWEEGGRGAGHFFKNLVPAAVLDPTNLIGFGSGKAAGVAAAQAGRLALNKAGTFAGEQFIKEGAIAGAKEAFVKEGAVNAGVNVAADLMTQARDKEIGLQNDISLTRAGVAGATGFALGGGIGGAFGGAAGGYGAYKTSKDLNAVRDILSPNTGMSGDVLKDLNIDPAKYDTAVQTIDKAIARISDVIDNGTTFDGMPAEGYSSEFLNQLHSQKMQLERLKDAPRFYMENLGRAEQAQLQAKQLMDNNMAEESRAAGEAAERFMADGQKNMGSLMRVMNGEDPVRSAEDFIANLQKQHEAAAAAKAAPASTPAPAAPKASTTPGAATGVDPTAAAPSVAKTAPGPTALTATDPLLSTSPATTVEPVGTTTGGAPGAPGGVAPSKTSTITGSSGEPAVVADTTESFSSLDDILGGTVSPVTTTPAAGQTSNVLDIEALMGQASTGADGVRSTGPAPAAAKTEPAGVDVTINPDGTRTIPDGTADGTPVNSVIDMTDTGTKTQTALKESGGDPRAAIEFLQQEIKDIDAAKTGKRRTSEQAAKVREANDAIKELRKMVKEEDAAKAKAEKEAKTQALVDEVVNDAADVPPPGDPENANQLGQTLGLSPEVVEQERSRFMNLATRNGMTPVEAEQQFVRYVESLARAHAELSNIELSVGPDSFMDREFMRGVINEAAPDQLTNSIMLEKYDERLIDRIVEDDVFHELKRGAAGNAEAFIESLEDAFGKGATEALRANGLTDLSARVHGEEGGFTGLNMESIRRIREEVKQFSDVLLSSGHYTAEQIKDRVDKFREQLVTSAKVTERAGSSYKGKGIEGSLSNPTTVRAYEYDPAKGSYVANEVNVPLGAFSVQRGNFVTIDGKEVFIPSLNGNVVISSRKYMSKLFKPATTPGPTMFSFYRKEKKSKKILTEAARAAIDALLNEKRGVRLDGELLSRASNIIEQSGGDSTAKGMALSSIQRFRDAYEVFEKQNATALGDYTYYGSLKWFGNGPNSIKDVAAIGRDPTTGRRIVLEQYVGLSRAHQDIRRAMFQANRNYVPLDGQIRRMELGSDFTGKVTLSDGTQVGGGGSYFFEPVTGMTFKTKKEAIAGKTAILEAKVAEGGANSLAEARAELRKDHIFHAVHAHMLGAMDDKKFASRMRAIGDIFGGEFPTKTEIDGMRADIVNTNTTGNEIGAAIQRVQEKVQRLQEAGQKVSAKDISSMMEEIERMAAAEEAASTTAVHNTYVIDMAKDFVYAKKSDNKWEIRFLGQSVGEMSRDGGSVSIARRAPDGSTVVERFDAKDRTAIELALRTAAAPHIESAGKSGVIGKAPGTLEGTSTPINSALVNKSEAVNRTLIDPRSDVARERFANELGVPSTHVLAVYNPKTDEVRCEGTKNLESGIRQTAKQMQGKSTDEWILGTVPAGTTSGSKAAINKFMPLGDGFFDPSSAKSYKPLAVRNQPKAGLDASKAYEKEFSLAEFELNVKNPIVVADFEQFISNYFKGSKPSVGILNDYIRKMESTPWKNMSDITAFDQHVVRMESLYKYMAKVAPYGVRASSTTKNHSMRTLAAIFGKTDKEGVTRIAGLLRKMVGDAAPRFEKTDADIYGQVQNLTSKNFIEVNPKLTGEYVPADITIAHEIGHWGYHNLLTSADKMDFWGIIRKKMYTKDGQLNVDYLSEILPMGKAGKSVLEGLDASMTPSQKISAIMEKVGGNEFASAQELFANQWTQWLVSTQKIPYDEMSFIQRIALKMKGVVEAFFGRGKNTFIMPGLDEIFSRIVPDEHPYATMRTFSYDSVSPGAKSTLDFFHKVEERRVSVANAIETGETGKLNELLLAGIGTGAGPDAGIGPWIRGLLNGPVGDSSLLKSKIYMGKDANGKAKYQTIYSALLDITKRTKEFWDTEKQHVPYDFENVLKKLEDSGQSPMEMAREQLMLAIGDYKSRDAQLFLLGVDAYHALDALATNAIRRIDKLNGVDVRSMGDNSSPKTGQPRKYQAAANRIKREKAAAQEFAATVADAEVEAGRLTPAEAEMGASLVGAKPVRSMTIPELVAEFRFVAPDTRRSGNISKEIALRFQMSQSVTKPDVPYAVFRPFQEMGNEKLAVELANAFVNGDKQTAHIAAYLMYDRSRRKIAAGKNPKFLNVTDEQTRLAIDREIADSWGMSQFDSIPANTTPQVQEFLVRMTHREPTAQAAMRTVMYRLLNIAGMTERSPEGKTPGIGTEFVSKLANIPAVRGSLAELDVDSEAFLGLRKSLRKMATDGFDTRDVLTLISRVMDNKDKQLIESAYRDARASGETIADFAEDWFVAKADAYLKNNISRADAAGKGHNARRVELSFDKAVDMTAYVMNSVPRKQLVDESRRIVAPEVVAAIREKARRGENVFSLSQFAGQLMNEESKAGTVLARNRVINQVTTEFAPLFGQNATKTVTDLIEAGALDAGTISQLPFASKVFSMTEGADIRPMVKDLMQSMGAGQEGFVRSMATRAMYGEADSVANAKMAFVNNLYLAAKDIGEALMDVYKTNSVPEAIAKLRRQKMTAVSPYMRLDMYGDVMVRDGDKASMSVAANDPSVAGKINPVLATRMANEFATSKPESFKAAVAEFIGKSAGELDMQADMKFSFGDHTVANYATKVYPAMSVHKAMPSEAVSSADSINAIDAIKRLQENNDAYSVLPVASSDVGVSPVFVKSSNTFDASGAGFYDELVNNTMQTTGLSRESAERKLLSHLEDSGYDSVRISEPGVDGDLIEASIILNKGDNVRAADDQRFYDAAVTSTYDNVDRSARVNAELMYEIMAGGPKDTAAYDAYMSSLAGKAGVTSRVTGLFRKLLRKEDLNANDVETAKHFGPIFQMRSNTSRLRKMGADWYADAIQPENGTGLFERQTSEFARNISPILEALHKLPDASNGFKRWLDRVSAMNPFQTGMKQPDSYKKIVDAMRTNDFSKLDAMELRSANLISDKFRIIYEEMVDKGIMVGDASLYGGRYFPQVWDAEAIRRDLDGFINKMAYFFMTTNEDLRVKPRQEAIMIAKEKARSIAMRLESDGGVALPNDVAYGAHGGDQFFRRVLALTPDDVTALGMNNYMVNDLEGILVKYYDSATRRMALHERFGSNNHAFKTYKAVMNGGVETLIDLLQNKVEQTYRGRLRGVAEADIAEIVRTDVQPLANSYEQAYGIAEQLKMFFDSAKDKTEAKSMAKAYLESLYSYPDKYGQFSKRAEAIVNALADFGFNGGYMASSEVRFMDDLFNSVSHKPHGTSSQSLQNFSRGVKNVNAVTYLGMSTLTSIPDAILPAVISGRLGAWAKAMGQWYRMDDSYREAARRIGVGMENLIHDRLSFMVGSSSSKFTNGFFNMTLLTPWTEMQRECAALVGFNAFQVEQTRAQRMAMEGKVGSRGHREAMRFLDRFGLGEYGVPGAPALNDIRNFTQDEKVREAVIRFTNETIFAPNANDVPLMWQHPIGSIVFQLKSYPMMMGRASKYILNEAKEGNVRPLVNLLTVGSAFGMGALAIKDFMLSRGGEDEKSPAFRQRSFKKLAENFGFEVNTEAEFDKFFGWYVESILTVGGLGLIGELLYNSAEKLDNGAYGRIRMTSSILGPSYSTMQSGLDVVAGALESVNDSDKNSQRRQAVRSAVQSVPMAGSNRQFKEGMVDRIAGVAQDRAKPANLWDKKESKLGWKKIGWSE